MTSTELHALPAAGGALRPAAGVLLAVVAASLLVMSTLHLAGVVGGGRPPFQPADAGIAEGVIAVALLAAVVTWWRSPGQARPVAVIAGGFAMVGFLVGLTITAAGGDTVDVVYHCVTLPVLVAGFALAVRRAR